MRLQKADLSSLADQWPSSIVARNQIEQFSGGALTSKYMANLDSQGEGPDGRIRIGRKVTYQVKCLIRWMEGRAVIIEKNRKRLNKSQDRRG